MTRSCQRPGNIKQGEQVKIKALQAALYGRVNALIVFSKLVEIALSVN